MFFLIKKKRWGRGEKGRFGVAFFGLGRGKSIDVRPLLSIPTRSVDGPNVLLHSQSHIKVICAKEHGSIGRFLVITGGPF